MKKQKLTLLSILLVFTLLVPTSTSVFADSNSQYNRNNAAKYARTYALSPNSAYYNFESGSYGGDCTNFASQVLKYGGINMTPQKSSPTYADWYYNGSSIPQRTATWTGAHEFRQYFGNVNGSGYNHAYSMDKYTISTARSNWYNLYSSSWSGDIVQFVDSAGKTVHSAPISGFFAQGEYNIGINLSYRSTSGGHKLDRSLYDYLNSWPDNYHIVVLHIKNGS